MFLPPIDILHRVMIHLGQPAGDVAASIPLVAGQEKISAVVFLHGVVATPGSHLVYPPRVLVHVDPTTGAILAGRAIAPRDIGPDAPPDEPCARHPDERRRDDVDVFWAHHHRLMSIFHEAWWAYARGQARFNPETRRLVVECAALFDEVAEKRVLPWYEGIGGRFLTWMRSVKAEVRDRPR